ncbi:MAG: SDR family oxidoreductase [Rhodovibrionaceae bacterium]
MSITPTDPKSLTVFITGATSGFGAATAKRFAAAGAKVIVTGRRQERLDELKQELGDKVHAAKLDVQDKDSVDSTVSGLPEDFRNINVLVNNAGLALGLEPAQAAKMQDWETMVQTNITGLLYCTRALLPLMCERDEGHVINLGSVAGSYPYPGGNVYGATKAFVAQFSLNLRADLIGHNVRVTSVEPGMAETEFSAVRFKGDSEKAKGVYSNIQPMTPDDIAEAIYWIATLPRHVNINRIEMMPVMQAFNPFNFHRDG